VVVEHLRRRRAPRGSGEQLREEILDATTDCCSRRSRQIGVHPVGGAARRGDAPSIYCTSRQDALLDAVCARYFEKLDEEMWQLAAISRRRSTCCARRAWPTFASR